MVFHLTAGAAIIVICGGSSGSSFVGAFNKLLMGQIAGGEELLQRFHVTMNW